MPSDSFRDAAQQNAVNAIAAMTANYDKIGPPVPGGVSDQLYRVADRDEFCRFHRNW